MRTVILRLAVVLVLAGAVCAGSGMVAASTGQLSGAESAATTGAAEQAGNAAVCEASAGTRRALHELSSRETFTDSGRREYLRAVDALLTKNPDDVFLHLDYIVTENRESVAEVTAMVGRYKALMEKHPGNSEYEFLYAAALVNIKTPEAIERLKRIPVDAAIEPQAQLRLTKIYEFGKFADRDEARRRLIAYLKVCPASVDMGARDLAERLATPELATVYAAPLRSRLEKEHDSTLLSAWGTVWNLEFAATPGQQEQVRARVTQDLQRLRKKPLKDLDYLTTMQAGYRMAGDKKSQREMEDRIVTEYPDSSDAEMAESQRFEDEHPYPKQEESAKAKQAFHRAVLARADAELKKNPQKSEALRDRFDALNDLDGVSSEEIANAGEVLRSALKGELQWYNTPPIQFQIAREYLDRSIRVAEVPDLIAEGRANYERFHHRSISDQETEEMIKGTKMSEMFVLVTEAELSLDAARVLEKPEIAKAVVEKVSAEKNDAQYFKIEAWEIKGKWAELNGRKLDALMMYRASLDARPAGYKSREKKDEPKEGYARLWKELGGTDDGSDAWLAAVAGAKIANDDSWEKVSKDLPDAKLMDLNGKMWSLSELKGKTLLINVWATWCGPCQGEHPHLQALYDKVKDRKDVAVLSMSVDDSIGDVAPYMKDKKYSFPVLLAAQYVNGLTPDAGVPQNWIVDAQGKWKWMQVGFGEGNDWEKKMMEKLEGVEKAEK
jgi:thiol-disulfide isomerase/thioredoxin